MLPQSHVAYTWLALSLCQEYLDAPEVDYRLVALAATGPDLIDKPLAAAWFYKRTKSAVLFAHTLLVNLIVLLTTPWRSGRAAVYALSWLAHAMIDRLWYYPDTFYWPLRGWRFHVWGKRGSEQENMGWAYWVAFTRRPELWGWEAGGLLALALFIVRHRLYRFANLRTFLLTGRPAPRP